jgi:two-component system OmpR family sensor kinase
MGNVLQMTRLENDAIVPQRDWDSLAEIAGCALERVAGRLAGHRLMVELPGDLPLVRVDPILVEQALGNLLENALRYGGSQPVVLEVLPPCTLAVRDFGPGVGSAQLQTLHQRHVRHSADRAGYGLGLSIVHTIADKHGARLELLSPPPGAASGLEVRIVLPPTP